MLVLGGVVAVGCGGGDDDSSEGESGGGSINVAIVGNPQMEDIASLTPELFTEQTGINVEYTVLEERTLREIVTRDVGAGGQQFDVVMIGMFEAPQFGRNGWLVDLTQYAAGDADYNVDDLIPAVRDGLSVDGGLYAAPFYAESSFLMYRKDVLDAAGVTMPDAPTWDEVAEIARGRHRRDGRHLPARQARLGRPRRRLHHRAQHVRRHLVVARRERHHRRRPDRPARVQGSPAVLRRPPRRCGRGRRGQRQLQRVHQPDARWQGGDVVRRHRRGQQPRGR